MWHSGHLVNGLGCSETAERERVELSLWNSMSAPCPLFPRPPVKQVGRLRGMQATYERILLRPQQTVGT